MMIAYEGRADSRLRQTAAISESLEQTSETGRTSTALQIEEGLPRGAPPRRGGQTKTFQRDRDPA